MLLFANQYLNDEKKICKRKLKYRTNEMFYLIKDTKKHKTPKVITVHPHEDMNACTTLHDNPSNSS